MNFYMTLASESEYDFDEDEFFRLTKKPWNLSMSLSLLSSAISSDLGMGIMQPLEGEVRHRRRTNDELTKMRKLAKSPPCHFVFGRNRNLQGLASAILRLWEKSLVTKIGFNMVYANTMNKWLRNRSGGQNGRFVTAVFLVSNI